MGVIWRYPCIHLKVEVCKNIYWKIIKWNLRLSSGWWLNQPIWKICSSNWVHLPQFSGRKFQKIIELPPPSHGITYQLSNLVTSASSFIQKPPDMSQNCCIPRNIHQVHGWFEAQKIPGKSSDLYESVYKMPPRKGKPPSWKLKKTQWKLDQVQIFQKLPPFFHGEKTPYLFKNCWS